MVLTGAFLYFPALALYLDRPTAKMLHLWAAIALPARLAGAGVLGDRRALGRTLREADRFDADDMRWLKGGPRRLVNRDHEPPQGRLNAGQKMNLAVTMGLLVVLGASGTLLWLGERDTTYRFAGSVHVHDLATLAITFLISGHLYLALIHPVTSNALSGMTTGSVDREWARRHHGKWVDGRGGGPSRVRRGRRGGGRRPAAGPRRAAAGAVAPPPPPPPSASLAQPAAVAEAVEAELVDLADREDPRGVPGAAVDGALGAQHLDAAADRGAGLVLEVQVEVLARPRSAGRDTNAMPERETSQTAACATRRSDAGVKVSAGIRRAGGVEVVARVAALVAALGRLDQAQQAVGAAAAGLLDVLDGEHQRLHGLAVVDAAGHARSAPQPIPHRRQRRTRRPRPP